jgi:hypothetical protein
VRDVIGSPGKGTNLANLNSIVFHKIPTVDFDLAAISVTVCEGSKCLPLYFNTCLLDRISQNILIEAVFE